jgi:Mg2+/Co2+ transporter CorB
MSSTNSSFLMVIFMVLCGALFATSATIVDTAKQINSSAAEQQQEALAQRNACLGYLAYTDNPNPKSPNSLSH